MECPKCGKQYAAFVKDCPYCNRSEALGWKRDLPHGENVRRC